MKTRLIEVYNDFNFGKFLVGRFDEAEWSRRSAVDGFPLLGGRGWSHNHLLIVDLATGEGAIFLPGGKASYDLNQKHQIWVCLLYEPFLSWLYTQDLIDLDALPEKLYLEAPTGLAGYRREGEECGGIEQNL